MNFLKSSVYCCLMILGFFLFFSISLKTSAAASDLCADGQGKTLRWIIPYPAGGGYDIYSRLIAPYLEKELDVKVYIDHVIGASGMIAAKDLQAAPPDGRTLALLNGSALLMAVLYGETEAPHPLEDMTLLCRLSRRRSIMLSSPKSSLMTIEDVIETGKSRPIVFATGDLGGSDFVPSALLPNLLGIKYRIIPGYRGIRALCMAVIQGEVDVAMRSSDSVVRWLENGELIPLLRLSEQSVPGLTWYNKLPSVEGKNGLAVSLAKANGADPRQAEIDAQALTVMASHTLDIFGPPGMKKETADCVEKALVRVLNNPEFIVQAKKADRDLDPAGSKEASAVFAFLEQNGKKYADHIKREAEALK